MQSAIGEVRCEVPCEIHGEVPCEVPCEIQVDLSVGLRMVPEFHLSINHAGDDAVGRG